MGFPASSMGFFDLIFGTFQSLVGVYGFSRCARLRLLATALVSIPSRGLWVFPLLTKAVFVLANSVSIPSRGFWVFPLSISEAVGAHFCGFNP